MKYILGIESSCDETSVAVVSDGRKIHSNVISTQIETHKQFGGVVPEIASRMHTEAINAVYKQALKESGISVNDISAIAVTAGPGLVGALLVGVSFAKSLAYATDKPLVPVHHIEGHIAANYLAHENLEPPFVCLVASGGHSHIVYVKNHYEFEILGRSRDDAAGEAFDKVSRVLGFGYPGGPAIEREAKNGDKDAIKFPRVHFENSLDFSFSGVKTSVINYLHKAEQKGEEINKNDVAASFQNAAVEILTENTIKAAIQKQVKTICLAGGVASNTALRQSLYNKAKQIGAGLYYPPPVLCTDNAAMIAAAGFYEFENKTQADLSLNAYPSVSLGDKFAL